MQPLYFNPLSNSDSNFIGTNPLKPTGVPVKTTVVSLSLPYPVSCFDPSLYEPYTFFSYPFPPFSYAPTTFFKSTLLGSDVVYYTAEPTPTHQSTVQNFGDYWIVENYSTQVIYFSQFSTFYSTCASFYEITPVVFSIRFGTEVKPLFASTANATNFISVYENIYTEEIYWYNIQTIIKGALGPIPYPPQDTWSSLLGSGLYASFVQSDPLPQPDGMTFLGSSSFVNMLGSNVYSALLDTTNSVIIYQNEQISTYYSQSLSYQINIINLTAALNSVSGDSPDNAGNGIITVTLFSWAWESTVNGWTGSQVTTFDGYTYEQTVNSYLYFTYGGTIIYGTGENLPTTIVQSLLSIQNNNLANAQTFLNNAVTTLQSQVSLAGQIITALASGMETLINNI